MFQLLKLSGYSDKAIECYVNKVNVGEIKTPDVVYTYTGSCGDMIKLYLKIESGIIKDAKFQATGCAGPLVSGSALTQIIKNKTLEQAKKVNEKNILDFLGEIPDSKHHCVSLAIKTLEETINLFEKKNLSK